MTDPGWRALTRELDAWSRAGRTARIWWRDDDVRAPGPALDRLLTLAEGRPLALAAIPAGLDLALPDRLHGLAAVRVLPHGHTHRNHEAPDRKTAEFGPARDPEDALREIRESGARLRDAFGPRYLPLFVPPWNRIATAIAQRLPEAGMAGLSAFSDRPPGSASPRRINTHVDPIDWSAKKRNAEPGFLGPGRVLDQLTGALRRRRIGAPGTDPLEPVGLLTHHRVQTEAVWLFLARLTEVLDGHEAVRWIDPEEECDPTEGIEA